jgi:hypothetical protein
MKLVKLFLLFFTLHNIAFGQAFLKPNNSFGVIYNRVRPDSAQGLPLDTFAVTGSMTSYPWLSRHGDSLYIYSTALGHWVLAGGSGGGGGSFVPTTRTLTINGTTYDLSANRSWTITTGSGTFAGLTDVNISLPQTNHIPVYNSSTSKWENKMPAILNLTSLANWDLLRDSSGIWVNFHPTYNSSSNLRMVVRDTVTGQYYQQIIPTGGGGGTPISLRERLFSIGDATFPQDGDSTFTDTAMINRHVLVYREGELQSLIPLASNYGITFTKSTGKITFRPPLSQKERIYIIYSDTAYWTTVNSGGGGLTILNNPTISGTVTESPSGTWNGTGTPNLVWQQTMATDGYYQVSVPTGTDGVVIGLSTTSTNTAYGSYAWALYQNASTYHTQESGSDVNTGITWHTTDWMRIRVTGSTVYAEYSTDSGVTWNAIRTYTASRSAGTLYLKVGWAYSNKVVNPKGSGVL